MINIILLNYNTPNNVLECVESIREFTSIPYKIFLVDNCSTDNSLDIFKRKFRDQQDLVIIESKSNLGYSGGNNLGLKESICIKSETTVIINPDVVLKNDAFSIMHKCLMESPKEVVLAGPSVLDIEGNESQFSRKPQYFWSFVNDRRPLCYLKINTGRMISVDFSQEKFTTDGTLSGCCFMIKSKVFESLNYFDDGVFLYCEEDILAHKFKERGYKSIICSKASVIHLHSVSISKRGNQFLRFYSLTSPLYVLKNYAKCGKIKMFVAKSVSILNYGTYALINTEYRKRFPDFLKRCLEI